ncbi:MAG: acetyl-CoA carboxylase, carboxyltransferase subunit beta [Vampirovibrionales bacterium]|jgi:acetyl-CoA carboxylase carboxyl transferase subunit beta|nr:acetyl-CoA carboxylase, carboxyltransferase subunit beta [Vampirovibrionales bacterium]
MMSLKNWFEQRRKQSTAHLDAEGMNRVEDAQYAKIWTKCVSCDAQLTKTDLRANLNVCPKCGYHHRISAKRRIKQLTDAFHELDAQLSPLDPLHFTDTEAYTVRQAEAEKKSKLKDAVITGIAKTGQAVYALAVMDFGYMGGSMGSVVGEKITRAAEKSLAYNLPLLVITASGGARMQEGMFSLMQMVKTSAVLGRLHERGLLYVTLLTEPTYGGVTASYGTLGDLILAEEGARIGFAGRRVIEQTIRQKLPADFQTAGYLQEYGQVDMVLHRHDLRQTLERLILLHQASSQQHPTKEALSLFSHEPVMVS